MITIKPTDLKGSINIPSSKSELIRALLFSILNDNEVEIENINYCDDVIAALNIVHEFKSIKKNDDKILLINKDLKSTNFNCGESALIARMLPSILALKLDEYTIGGMGSLFNRNIAESYKLFEKFGLKTTDSNFPFHFKVKITNADIEFESWNTSQTVSGLIAALPLLKKDSSINIKNKVSSPYLFLTIKMLKNFGIIILENNGKFIINGNQKYKRSNLKISSDSSSAAFVYALAQFHKDLQFQYFNNYEQNLDFEFLRANYQNKQFTNANIDIKDNPDLFFILIILAAAQKKTIEISSIDRLINKESNRLEIGINLLNLINCKFNLKNNTIIIGDISKLPRKIVVNSNNDHRVVMAALLIAHVFEIEVTIDGHKSVNKSYPNIFTDLKNCGANIIE